MAFYSEFLIVNAHCTGKVCFTLFTPKIQNIYPRNPIPGKTPVTISCRMAQKKSTLSPVSDKMFDAVMHADNPAPDWSLEDDGQTWPRLGTCAAGSMVKVVAFLIR